ncbi:UPF0758 protein YsxA [Sporosarcina sp. NCCP-2716]|uniref:RadC family protein n=1 Tax=Sporosarcina sp. NCCP-2716 TaxID=2943679 RepID=UPI002041C815|nr:DNA repair protein RadC [Sporosarcina sp. NCCP-2716]GKV68782.1 UPF0758 protein YsxA [Sporosarcina sp. NCCP-2716]
MTADYKDTLMIRDIHFADRPRERMTRQGAASLSNQELVAILLRTGSRTESVLVLANKLLSEFDKIQDLRDVSIEELTAVKGIGDAKAVQIMAAAELGKRIYSVAQDGRYVIKSPEDAAAYLMTDLSKLNQEHFVVLFLNVKNEVLHKQTIFIGSLNSSIVHPREIFREAVKRSAASLVVAHNHPSGNATPSPEDIEVTKRLTEAGELMGIDLLDHIIIGDQRYISLKEKGYM